VKNASWQAQMGLALEWFFVLEYILALNTHVAGFRARVPCGALAGNEGGGG